MLDAGQAVAQRLLEHMPGIVRLLEIRLELLDLRLERIDAGVAAIDLDQLAGGGESGLLDLALELMQPDSELRPQLVLVGPNLGLGQRHCLLETSCREAHGTGPERRSDEQREQVGGEEAERDQHGRLDRDHGLIPAPPPDAFSLADAASYIHSRGQRLPITM